MGVTHLRRLGSKTSKKVLSQGQSKLFCTRTARSLLSHLHRHTQGRPIGVQAWRSWLKGKLKKTGYALPSVEECGRLLQSLAQRRRIGGEVVEPLAAWKPTGVRYRDSEGSCEITNVEGHKQISRGSSPSSALSWHEHGKIYRLHRSHRPGSYQVVCTNGFKRLSCAIHKRTVQVSTGAEKFDFKGSLVINPRTSTLSSTPLWSFIYLHSFSSKGVDYANFPHYFTVGGAAVRAVLPTAPFIEQTCFEDWMVWRGKKLRWRRIKFNSWFDYLTDKAGSGENHIDLDSLLKMRARIHALIRSEIQRVGDPKRVIIGGASQGCCVALDSAMTYPQELGGVIGLVGHILGSTPLDPSKRKMPIHLFHEESDREMRWDWVKGTVQRLVSAGYNVSSKRELDPTGNGHWIQEIEGEWIRGALRKIIWADRL